MAGAYGLTVTDLCPSTCRHDPESACSIDALLVATSHGTTYMDGGARTDGLNCTALFDAEGNNTDPWGDPCVWWLWPGECSVQGIRPRAEGRATTMLPKLLAHAAAAGAFARAPRGAPPPAGAGSPQRGDDGPAWVHSGAVWWARVSAIADDAGLLLYSVVVVPRDAAMREIDAEVAELRRDIAAGDAESGKQKDAAFGAATSSAAAAILAIAAVPVPTVAARRVVRPLLRLRADMGRVAKMELDVEQRAASSLREVADMEQQLAVMCRALKEYKAYTGPAEMRTVRSSTHQLLPTPRASRSRSHRPGTADDDRMRDLCADSHHSASSIQTPHGPKTPHQRPAGRVSHVGHVHLELARKTASLMTTNLVGFTAFTVDMQPAHINTLHEQYIAGVSRHVTEHKGLVDIFAGDRVGASYNAGMRRYAVIGPVAVWVPLLERIATSRYVFRYADRVCFAKISFHKLAVVLADMRYERVAEITHASKEWMY
eukprot:gene34310-11015_t